MFKHLFTTPRRSNAGSCLVTCLFSCLILLAALSAFRQHEESTFTAAGNRLSHEQHEPFVNQNETNPVSRHLTGAAARKYLQEPGEGQSLMQAITAARFGLKRQERAPSGEAGAGYLGMSHVQNLNAWFGEDGITVHPTVPAAERERAWHMKMRLKAYGYGSELIVAPPIVSEHVKDNRIEYERNNCRLEYSAFGDPPFSSAVSSRSQFASNRLLQSAIANRQSAITEWYENRAEGIEQGFTIAARPERNSATGAHESLRVVISLTGELRARPTDKGRTIELTDATGKRALSYGKLTALDANKKELAAHMEVSADGGEITLVVDDSGASYPIVIDPIVATLEKILDATLAPAGVGTESGAQFGDAVAIDRDLAVVGAWLDGGASGTVYFFARTGSVWSLKDYSFGSLQAGAKCGYSVAISNDKVVYGCPGANANAGIALVEDLTANRGALLNPGSNVHAGDFFGASVAIINANIVVGAPGTTLDGGKTNVGLAYQFTFDSMLNVSYRGAFGPSQYSQNDRFGDAVAIDAATLLIGEPGTNRVVVEAPGVIRQTLQANDSAAGDLFGQNVAISGNTAVIGAPANDEKGTDAGAAYVFVRDAHGQWSQQQKLTASDGRANDLFSYYAAAIEGNTVVVGARRQDLTSSDPNNNSGAAYIFTRSGTVWSQQTKLSAGGFYRAPGDEFGTSVGISGNTVIVSAPHETATDGTVNAGTFYVYRLNCTAPYSIRAEGSADNAPFSPFITTVTACPGHKVTLGITAVANSGNSALSYQWRKNGADIQGATSALYVISSAVPSDAASYDALVSNACGSDISTRIVVAVSSSSLSPNQNFSASGSPGIVSVTSSCDWTAVSNDSFITVTSGSSGSGNGTVGFAVAGNNGPARTGTLTIAGQTFTVTQDGAAPSPTPTPTPNVVQFSSSNYSVQEDCTTVTVTVNRIGDASSAASVDYSTSDVSATERKDYITARGSLRFAAGETSKSFAVLINEDSFVEGNETFSVALTNPSGLTLGGPAIATVTIIDDPTEGANPIDDPQNFVCQHYHDFLNRQPDAPGLAFWTGQITACGTDQACIETRRINVSASFFLSIEFQDTGYLVERIYKAAYGDATGNSTFPSAHQLAVPEVRLNEFLSDTQEIGQGVIVGQGNWQQQLENNKQSFTAAFVQRSRFLTAWPASMTAAQFVDTLNANAGNPLSSSERNQLVSDLSTNAKTRAQVLRAVAEDTDLNIAESNRAFVLMQYFGYLRRNPNDPQDSDHTGYDFWLTKLNQFNGNYINAEMVKAFITSIEYRQRFGP